MGYRSLRTVGVVLVSSAAFCLISVPTLWLQYPVKADCDTGSCDETEVFFSCVADTPNPCAGLDAICQLYSDNCHPGYIRQTRSSAGVAWRRCNTSTNGASKCKLSLVTCSNATLYTTTNCSSGGLPITYSACIAEGTLCP